MSSCRARRRRAWPPSASCRCRTSPSRGASGQAPSRRRRPCPPCPGRCLSRPRSETPCAPQAASPPPRQSVQVQRAPHESSSHPSQPAIIECACRIRVMIHPILGLHHVTATVDDAQADLDFCLDLLGLRLVKKTVNFDNHDVYHFYYGTE